MSNTSNIQQWTFKPRSPLILFWIAIPFFLAVWLAWFAFSVAGSLDWVFVVLSVLCACIGILGLKSWFKSWRNTRSGQEFIRLDEDCLSYSIYGIGSGNIQYTWLRSVYPVYSRGFQGVVLEYRQPETGAVLDKITLTNLYRLDLREYGLGLIEPHDVITGAIKARCLEGQLYQI